jgi:hypothetical protein
MLMLGGTAAAQPTPAARAAGLPQLPETALLSASSTSVLPPSNGLRYQYQSVRVYNDERIYLAPAWHGSSKLEPPRKGLFSNADPGEVDALLLTALNGLTEEGWEMVEIQSLMQPVSASQKVETDLQYNDPNRPTYTGTTTIATRTQTRYLFRRPIGK